MSNVFNFRIESERLIIREFNRDDIHELIDISEQPHIQRWLPDWKNACEWVENWIETVKHHYITDDPETDFLAYGVELKQTGRLIGQVGIGGTENGIAVGYFISQEFTNNGYATEAMKAFIDYIFKKYGYIHLIATVQPDNTASNRVVQKLGFDCESIIEFIDNGQTEILPFNYYHIYNKV